METLLKENSPVVQKDDIGLQALVSRLVAVVTPVAIRNKSFIINSIPAGLCLSADCGMATEVLSNLLKTVAIHATDCCIRISAKCCGNTILVLVRNHHSTNAITIANSLQGAQPLAEKMGGYLGITSQREDDTTIVFSFPNIPVAA